MMPPPPGRRDRLNEAGIEWALIVLVLFWGPTCLMVAEPDPVEDH